MTKEIWKPVPGYENYYEISNTAKVRNIKTKKVRKTQLTTTGYYKVDLKVNGKKKTKRIHRLLASAFIEAYSEDKIVDHIDGNRLNNNIENLRITTARQNVQNQCSRGGTSIYRGVCYDKNRNKWHAGYKTKNKKINIGRFESEIQAAMAVDKAIRKEFGEYGTYNFPVEGERSIFRRERVKS